MFHVEQFPIKWDGLSFTLPFAILSENGHCNPCWNKAPWIP